MRPERWPVSWWAALTPLGQDAVLIVLLLGYGLSTLRERPGERFDDPSTVGLLVLTTVPLVLRRRWPTPV
ncbi:MAG: hypothetical protein E6J41_15755, partial [Chloroflexi bacterium]